MKLLFFARDIRGGLGERRVFRIIFAWLAKNEPDSVRKNLKYVAEFGRFDDLLVLFGTPCEKEMLELIGTQLSSDIKNKEIPARLIIISDMEFNCCVKNASESNFSNAKKEYAAKGYALPGAAPFFWKGHAVLEIKGKRNTAICHARVIEDGAVEQIRRMCDYALTEGSRIRIMPDVHAGKGCTIGTTMTVADKVCPNIVGVDIGCGMYTVKLADKALDFERIDAVCHYIPSGMNVWEERPESFDLSQLRCFRSLKNSKRLERSLGTLGGGNHFIEADKAADGVFYLVIHSGSRNLGRQVAEIYQQLAIDLHAGREDRFIRREEIISGYKAEGRQSEIRQALEALEKEYAAKTPDVPEDLAWLYGSFLKDYLHDIEICQRFACRNREKMAEIILEKTGMTAVSAFHTIHNYIDTQEMILRKGAVAAHAGERLLIPINMRDGSVLAIGKGNPEWNYSAPHGAGRVMSRAEARRSVSLEEYKASMEGIYTSSVKESTIDEAPMAYKSLKDITDVIGESVDILDIIRPVYNFKAAEEDLPWKKRKLR